MKKIIRFLGLIALATAIIFVMNACDDFFGDDSDVPTGLTATATSSSVIRLTWNAVSGATKYGIYANESATGTYTKLGEVDSSPTDVTDIPPNTTRYYKVTAFTSNGESAQSSYASATTLPSVKTDPAVTWPTGLTATVGQTLADISLTSYTNDPAGTFTWTNPTAPVGAAGQQSHNMTFTPTNTASYNTLTHDATVTVSDPPPPISISPGSGTVDYVEDALGQIIRFSANAAVQDFAYVQLYPTTVGVNTEYMLHIVLHRIGDLNTGEFFTVKADIGSGIPTRGILYRHAGVVKYFTIREDGLDGSFYLTEFTPYLAPVTLGLPYSTNIDADTEHWFRVDVADSAYLDAYTCDMNMTGNTPDTVLTVYDAAMNEIASNDDDPFLSAYQVKDAYIHTKVDAGIYIIKVGTWQNAGSGPYTLNVTVGPVLELTNEGSYVDGNIPNGYGKQWFKFTATNSTQYIHFIAGTLDDVYIVILDADGEQITNRINLYGSNNKIDIDDFTPGKTYYIVVYPFSTTSSGTYQIAFSTSGAQG